MQKEEYLIKNACYSVTKYYLCKRNNKRSFFSSKQRHKAFRSFPNRYQFSCINKVTSLFSISCISRIIFICDQALIGRQSVPGCETACRMYRPRQLFLQGKPAARKVQIVNIFHPAHVPPDTSQPPDETRFSLSVRSTCPAAPINTDETFSRRKCTFPVGFIRNAQSFLYFCTRNHPFKFFPDKPIQTTNTWAIQIYHRHGRRSWGYNSSSWLSAPPSSSLCLWGSTPQRHYSQQA